MEERKIKLQITTNRQSITPEYVIESLFSANKKSDARLPSVALQILNEVSIKGSEGLYIQDWTLMCKNLNVTKFQYFRILRLLKNANLIKKSNGRYYISPKFTSHLSEMSSTLNKYFVDRGVNLSQNYGGK